MVFKSQNKIRKCKWCNNPPKENIQIVNGKPRKKGYYRTCGSDECKERQYKDTYICKSKGVRKSKVGYLCQCCDQEFKSNSINHRRFCEECVPDASWRSRATRYGIGKKQWEELLVSQQGRCALCDRTPEVVDHCHNSHVVRGLLCNKCNGNIKLLDMDEEFIDKAIKYTGRKI